MKQCLLCFLALLFVGDLQQRSRACQKDIVGSFGACRQRVLPARLVTQCCCLRSANHCCQCWSRVSPQPKTAKSWRNSPWAYLRTVVSRVLPARSVRILCNHRSVPFCSFQSFSTYAMALFSAFGLIRAIAIFHLTLAYFLLTNPYKLANHNLV